jgi:hypothetical protein
MMNLNLFLLSVIVMVNAVSGTPSNVPPVPLGNAAGEFAILAKAAISTVPSSTITGNIAVSPITSAAITGFSLIIDSSGTFSTSTQVTGDVKAPDYTATDGTNLVTAVSDMEAAYDNAAGRSNTDAARINLEGGKIGGETLTPGVYTFTSNVAIGGDLTFTGSATDVFIIQTTGSVIQDAATNMILKGGVKAGNIFWQVAGLVDVGAGAHMEGVLLVKTSVTFITGSSLNGRIFAQTAVTLQMATITETPYKQVTEVRRGLRGLQVA